MRIGDIVSINKYGEEVIYKIDEIKDDKILLKGLLHRTTLIVDRNKELKLVSSSDSREFAEKTIKNNEVKIKRILKDRKKNLKMDKINYSKPKVLHLDADKNYLEICKKFYEVMDIDYYGYVVDEPNQPQRVRKLLEEHNPDILVVTGHDVDRDDNDIYEISDYENSKFYAEATRQARLFNASKRGLVIISGACQSDYERIMDAGANFASSPARIMIDVLDPCYVAERVAYTEFTETITSEEVVKYTTTKNRGIGGIETYGVLRKLNPSYFEFGDFKQV